MSTALTAACSHEGLCLDHDGDQLPRLETAALSTLLHNRLKEWRTLLAAEPVKARQILRKLLGGQRLVFTPDPKHKSYTFTGHASYGRLLEGVLQEGWCPRGGPKPPTP